VDFIHLDIVVLQDLVQVFAAGPIKQIDTDPQPGFLDGGEIDLGLDELQVIALQVDFLDILQPRVIGVKTGARERRRTSSSTLSVSEGRAGAPVSRLSFSPLYSGGLKEAVKLIPACALRLMIWRAWAWAGASRSASQTPIWLWERILVASLAYRSERKRVS
jgi:hypothetical protein